MKIKLNAFVIPTLCFIIFIDFLGYGIILPALVPLLFSDQLNLVPLDIQEWLKHLILSLVLAIFPIAQFFGAYFIGGLADKYGRKKILTLTITGSVIGYLTFLLGFLFENIYVLIFGRAIAGFMSGNVTLVNTIISDLSSKQETTKNYSFIGLSIGLGLVFGPYIGSKLSTENYISELFNLRSIMLPFYISVILSILSFVLVILFIPETFNLKSQNSNSISIRKEFNNFIFNVRRSKLRHVFWSSFLLFLAFNIFVYSINLYLFDILKFTTNQIANFLTYTAISLIISMGILTPITSKYLKPYQVLKISLFMLGIVLLAALYLLHDSKFVYILTFLFIIFYATSYANLSALISLIAQDTKKGESFGTNQSLHALAEGIAPITSAYFFNILPTMPFGITMCICFISWLILTTKIKKLV